MEWAGPMNYYFFPQNAVLTDLWSGRGLWTRALFDLPSCDPRSLRSRVISSLYLHKDATSEDHTPPIKSFPYSHRCVLKYLPRWLSTYSLSSDTCSSATVARVIRRTRSFSWDSCWKWLWLPGWW